MNAIRDEYAVTLLPGGETFLARAGESVLDAALRHGIMLPHECRRGTCGSCRAECKAGSLEQATLAGSLQSAVVRGGQKLLACLAVPQDDVVLECVPVEPRFLPRKLPARVRQITFPADDVAVVHLQLGAGQSFSFRAGHYLNVALPGGPRRSYSLARPGLDGSVVELELHIRRVPGGAFSNQVFDRLKVRDVVRLEGPYGHFHLRDDHEGPLIFLATGTGFAPIKAILEEMRLAGDKREVSFYWGGRQLNDLYLHKWVQELRATMPRLRYVPVLSRDPDWKGRLGWVQDAALADCADVRAVQVYACGSPAMIADAQRQFCFAGLREDNFFADAFLPTSAVC